MYGGQVTLGSGNWTEKGSNNIQPRSDMVFHELAENYYRTNNKAPYGIYNKDGKNVAGAHVLAQNLAKRFKKQSTSEPGTGGKYIPSN
ncbi:MAG: hypothetical protein J0M18_00535 [Ignavibacteria bacterium]|nr:hypothetical protein [Ignavibacteria bacterium]